MENKCNKSVIDSLNSLQEYAEKFEERIGNTDEEAKKKEEDFVKKYLQSQQKLSIQEQIAETLRQAKIKEDQKKRELEEKRKHEEVLQEILSSQLEEYERDFHVFDSFEESLAAFHLEELEMDQLAKETQLIIEREEKKRREKEELLKMLQEKEEERKRIEAEEQAEAEKAMKEKIFKELQLLNMLQSSGTKEKVKGDEMQREDEILKKEKEERETERRRLEEEKKIEERMKMKCVQEEARKMTFASAMKDFLKSQIKRTKNHVKKDNTKSEEPKDLKVVDKSEKLKNILEDDKRKAEELQRKRQDEEETMMKARQEEEMRKAEVFEELKKFEHEKKIRDLEKKEKEVVQELPTFDRKCANLLPILAKFEHLAALNKEEQRTNKRIKRREKKSVMKRSRQILYQLKSVVIKRSSSNTKIQEKETESFPAENKESMKNYLLSHILFDKHENIKSSEDTHEDSNNIRETETATDAYFDIYKKSMEEYFKCLDDNHSTDKKFSSERSTKKTNFSNIDDIKKILESENNSSENKNNKNQTVGVKVNFLL